MILRSDVRSVELFWRAMPSIVCLIIVAALLLHVHISQPMLLTKHYKKELLSGIENAEEIYNAINK